MVLYIPEVSKCVVKNEQQVSALCESLPANKINKHNLAQLSHILQTSLETDKILQLFFKQIKQYFKLTKLLYINDAPNISVILGNNLSYIQSHKKFIQKFELYYQQEFLGEITFASKNKFTPGKIFELKTYVNFLILPLKNSLLYTAAIKATKTDSLTNTGNKLSLIEDMKYHVNLSTRFNSPLSIIFLDIDYFKNINDTHGHINGDKILVDLSKLLKSVIRKSDLIYRYGGEEFVIILENTNQHGAVNLARKLKSSINKNRIILNNDDTSNKQSLNHYMNITVSMGIASKSNNDSSETLMQRADDALYLAKENGRNKYVFKSVSKSLAKLSKIKNSIK